MKKNCLQITEIVPTIGGEASLSGWPCVLVRLTGCPLRCTYCDSAHAFLGGRRMAVDDLVDEIRAYTLQRVLITGGEPLAQEGCIGLLERLLAGGLEVHLETSGALDVSAVPEAVHRVIDVKLASSGEYASMCWGNLNDLRPQDEIKFVVANARDLEQAISLVERNQLAGRCTLLLSPVWGQMDPVWLASQMLKTTVPFKLNLQIHKLAFGPRGDNALLIGASSTE